jgi:hypothetical protein
VVVIEKGLALADDRTVARVTVCLPEAMWVVPVHLVGDSNGSQSL